MVLVSLCFATLPQFVAKTGKKYISDSTEHGTYVSFTVPHDFCEAYGKREKLEFFVINPVRKEESIKNRTSLENITLSTERESVQGK